MYPVPALVLNVEQVYFEWLCVYLVLKIALSMHVIQDIIRHVTFLLLLCMTLVTWRWQYHVYLSWLYFLFFIFSCVSVWRHTLLYVRMPTRYCILGTKMILLDLLCGMRVKWVLELDHSINICTSSSVLHSSTGTTIQGNVVIGGVVIICI